MTELKCAIDVCMLVIGMELKTRNCCSVCSMNYGQFALLYFVCVRRVRVVVMIGRWSERSVCTVRHVVFCSSVGEQKYVWGGCVVVCLVWDVSVLLCVVKD